MTSSLFTPIKVGDLELPNRVFMAPLTRLRSSEGRVPNALMAEYYAQRASAGMILSEATSVTPQGVGYPDSPGIWSEEQVAGWQLVTDAVHKAGGRIYLQLWHVGRISDPIYLDGELPVAPSAIAAEGHVSLVRPKKDFVVPRALELAEIPGVVAAYRKGAENAKRAGFDGVEVHGANGYLLDQFMQDSTNKRSDAYGGSIENRARLILEVVDACIDVWGKDRVGVHLSPRGASHSISDSDPLATFGYVLKELDRRGIAFVFIREVLTSDRLGPQFRKLFRGVYIINDGVSKADAESVLQAGEADAVAFGREFIANPDLPARLKEGVELNPQNAQTFYGGGAEGYTDYPALA